MMWKISTGFSMLPISGSSVMIRSISTLAWMKSPSVLRRTVPLMPMRQCSCAHRTAPVTCRTHCYSTDIRCLSTMERKGNSRQSRSHSYIEKSLKHETEEQNKLQLTKEPSENKAESSLSYLAWWTTPWSGKTQIKAKVRHLDFFNHSKAQALSWKVWQITTSEESTKW